MAQVARRHASEPAQPPLQIKHIGGGFPAGGSPRSVTIGPRLVPVDLLRVLEPCDTQAVCQPLDVVAGALPGDEDRIGPGVRLQERRQFVDAGRFQPRHPGSDAAGFVHGDNHPRPRQRQPVGQGSAGARSFGAPLPLLGQEEPRLVESDATLQGDPRRSLEPDDAAVALTQRRQQTMPPPGSRDAVDAQLGGGVPERGGREEHRAESSPLPRLLQVRLGGAGGLTEGAAAAGAAIAAPTAGTAPPDRATVPAAGTGGTWLTVGESASPALDRVLPEAGRGVGVGAVGPGLVAAGHDSSVFHLESWLLIPLQRWPRRAT